MSATESTKRSAAEARRLKLLARGRDRLQQITQGPAEANPVAEPKPDLATARLTDTSEAAAQPSNESFGKPMSDRVLSRSQSLPQESTHSLGHSADGLPPAGREPTNLPAQPVSPPPNTLWNTPRVSTRTDTGYGIDTPFATSAEDRKPAGRWAKYADSTPELNLTKNATLMQRQRINWHQACNAAVQTTHLLRMLAALLLAVLLRQAKSVIYGEQQIAPWQRPLLHLYDVPPVILLGIIQLSAIGVVAWQSKRLPSCIPETVYRRISVDGSSQAKGVGFTLERLAATFAPAAVGAYHKFGLTKTVIRAISEGMCVFLLACMLLNGWW